MNASTETRHLLQGPLPGESAGWLTLQSYRVTFRQPADIALQNIQLVLQAVLQHSVGSWPSVPEWASRLPDWFVRACETEPTPEQHQARFAAWQRLSAEERARHSAQAPWSVQGWLYWLHPDRRTWHWWEAQVLPASTPFTAPEAALITLALREAPCPIGAFEWLLRAATASSIQTYP